MGLTAFRSFGAQLLANAQAAAVNKVVQKPVVPPPAKPKVTVKPKPENIIEVSSDTEQKKTQEKTANRRASRKKVHTLTQVLTARSKVDLVLLFHYVHGDCQAACGLKDELEEKVDDIDAADVHDQLAVVDYIEDIYAFYKKAEV
ncbi:cyclin-B1-1-like [Amborella trichopoda]|uniref:cyclin-B1-1-like n=1 Tax=Amborella trichopoda TaxID=13333 RepID=UPI0009C06F3A|nr:cyclin-B1-1-like [Amborella trichopoda]|eukprot:XP_020518487.1 cyclin-B1-1-like [Amborella trichopoda]